MCNQLANLSPTISQTDQKLRFTHTCILDIVGISEREKRANILPGLTHALLISINVLCKAGCKVQYDKNICCVYYSSKLVRKGRREPKMILWILPLWECNKTYTEAKTSHTKKSQTKTNAIKRICHDI